MEKGYQKDKTLANGKDVYIGIDVHKENWHVAARVNGEDSITEPTSLNPLGIPRR